MNNARSIAWVTAILSIAVVIFLVSKNQQAESPPQPKTTHRQDERTDSDSQPRPAQLVAADEAEAFRDARREMVKSQLSARDIVNQRVLKVMGEVRRHEFVPELRRDFAYEDFPLPIGDRQTISQPYIVALMTQLVDPQTDHKALDIGTGSGYQAAVLGRLVDQVYSIEIIESLASEAKTRLQRLGYDNITVRHGDGYQGWQEHAPFDIIIVAAAPDHIPDALIEQLAPNGKLVIPVGDQYQSLMLVEKDELGTSITKREIIPVRFVPMTGEAENDR